MNPARFSGLVSSMQTAVVCIALFSVPLVFSTRVLDRFEFSKFFVFQSLTVCLMLLTAARLLLEKRCFVRGSAFLFPVLLLVLSAAQSSLRCKSKAVCFYGEYASYQGFMTLCIYVIFFLIAASMPFQKKFLVCLLMAGVICSFIGILQVFGFVLMKDWPVEGRVYSTAANPVFLGSFLAMVLPVCLILFLADSGLLKVFSGFACVIVGAGCLLTFSRGAWLASFLSCVLGSGGVILLYPSKRQAFSRQVAVLGTMFLIILGLSLFYIQSQPGLRKSVFGAESVFIRLKAWKGALELSRQNPFGYGSDSFNDRAPMALQLRYGKFDEVPLKSLTPYKVHNEILETVFSYGFTGLFAQLWLWGLFVVSVLKKLIRGAGSRNNTMKESDVHLLVSFGVFVSFLVSGLFTYSVTTTHLLLWFFLGTGCSGVRQEGFAGKVWKLESSVSRIFSIVFLLCVFTWSFHLIYSFQAELYAARANELLKEGEFDAGAEYLERASRIMPSQKMYPLFTGEAYFFSKNYSKSIFFYREACGLDSNDAVCQGHLARAYDRRHSISHDQEDLNLALQHYEKALRLAPFSVRFHNSLGVVYEKKGDFQSALRAYQKAAQLDPKNANVRVNTASAYYALGKRQEAVGEALAALDISERMGRAYAIIGLAYADVGKLPEALESFLKAVKLEPRVGKHYTNAAGVYVMMGKKDKAREFYLRALEINPKDAIARESLERLAQN